MSLRFLWALMMPPIQDAGHHQDEQLEPRMFDFNGKDMPRNCGHVTGTDVRSRLSTNCSWMFFAWIGDI